MKECAVIILLGAGIPIGSTEKQSYENIVIPHILQALKQRADVVIVITGGKTRPKSYPEMSEARLRKDFILSLVTPYEHANPCSCLRCSSANLFLEEKARTTTENFRLTKELLKRKEIRPLSITIFGEHCKKLEIIWKVRHFFGPFTPIEFVGIRIISSRFKRFLQYLRTPLKIAELYIPPLAWLELALRNRTIKKR